MTMTTSEAATLTPRQRLNRKFFEFHRANPHVYERLVALARQAKERGHNRLSIKMLYEVLRWEHYLTTTDPNSKFKLSNNYHSRYARLIMRRNPDLEGFFVLKELHD